MNYMEFIRSMLLNVSISDMVLSFFLILRMGTGFFLICIKGGMCINYALVFSKCLPNVYAKILFMNAYNVEHIFMH